MKSNKESDDRIERISAQLLRYNLGDYSIRESYSENGDQIDALIAAVNSLGDELQASGKVIRDYEKRISDIMNILLKYTLLDFSEKMEVTNVGDEIDAIAVGLNTLGEELEHKIRREKHYTEDLEKLAVILETTADSITTTDLNGVFLTWNKASEQIYGYTAAEVIGKKAPAGFIPEDETVSISAAMERARKGEQISDFHTVVIRKDGTRINVSLTITPITDPSGKVISISNIARDITRQKKIELELRESEERFRLLVEEVKDYAIIMLDTTGHITSWNKGAETIKGYTGPEVLGKHFSIFYTEEELKDREPERNLGLARKNGRFEGEGWRQRKDGTQFWANVILTTIYDANGQWKGFAKITRDITEKKSNEKKVSRLNKELQSNITRLEESNSELEAFTYSVSHDLRAPLRAIHGYTKVLSKDYAESLDDEAKQMMEAVMSNAKKMGQLIDDLLALSRLGRKDVQRRMLEMTNVAQSVINDIQKSPGAEKTKIILHPLPDTEADFGLITQVFTNLISNAVKYSSHKEDPTVEIGSITENGDLVYFVRDNGAGFDMRYYNKLFGVFQRLHDAGEFEGTGVGLAIVKRIIVKHGGKIWAEAQPGKGATFYFTLS
jgi:PAS domain S-box-containing protein